MKYVSTLLACCLGMILVHAQPTSFENHGIGGGGSLFVPSINPHNPDEIFMACDMTQLFRSQDKGENWGQIHFDELVVTAYSEIQFANDSNILHTVGLDFRNDITFPARSLDGGETWQALPTPNADGIIYLRGDFNDPDRLLVTDYKRIYFTDDAGQNYSIAYQNDYGAYLAGVFWQGDSIFIGTNEGVTWSSDGGLTFQPFNSTGLPGGHGFSILSGVSDTSGVSLAGVMHPSDRLYPWIQASTTYFYEGIYRFDLDSSTAWSNISPAVSTNHKFWQIDHALSPDTFYIAGTNVSNSFPIIYKTGDRGATWTSLFKTGDNTNIETAWCGHEGDENWWYAESPMGFTVSPADPDHVMMTDFGTIHTTFDGGVTWRGQYTDSTSLHPMGSQTPKGEEYLSNGMENTSCWWMQWQSDQEIFAAFSDIGAIRSQDTGAHWTFDKVDRQLNSTYFYLPDTVNDRLYAATSDVHDMYQSTRLRDAQLDDPQGGILMTSDGGVSWDTLHDFGHSVIWLAFDPDDAEVMYASAIHSTQGGIYKTSNLSAGAASTWTKLTAPPGTEGHPFSIHDLGGNDLVCSYSGRRLANGSFTTSSGVFYSTNNGASWTNVGTSDMDYWTKDLVIDPHDTTMSTWYACVFSGWGGAGNNSGGVYRTKDRGQNWQRIADNFRVESVTVHPKFSNIMYFTTEDDGLWFSENAAAANPVFEKVDAYDFQHPVRVFFDPADDHKIWVTSFGNSIKSGSVDCYNVLQIDDVLLDPGTYTASEVILSKATIANHALTLFSAGETIELQEEFAVELGTEFIAEIDQCGSK